jgi:hypothetical protein
MKHIFLSIVMACSLLACTHAVDRNANTQNPIMPIVYYGEDGTETIYLTDYLPQVVDFGTLTFSTQEGYEVVKVELNEDFVKNFTIDDREILEDAITLAVNELTEQITDDKEGMLGDLAGSINIPGLR